MLGFPLAILTSLAVYLLAISLLPRRVLEVDRARMDTALKRLMAESEFADEDSEEKQERNAIHHPISRAFLLFPGATRTLPFINQANMLPHLHKLVMAGILLFVVVLFATSRFGWISIFMALGITYLLIKGFLNRRITKRKRAFLDAFPDALDMIVRSVRSGYPLNAALDMVAENMEPPISLEFKRIVDEARYGWTLNEALNRFADRIDEADVRFFVVVLAVQQDSGGNLSEVLSNLSRVLRQRKQLRLKIRALSSEGRATAWVLGSLPLFVFTVISLMTPTHLTPLYDTTAGHIIVVAVIGMVTMGMLIVKKMINVDI